MAHPAGAVPADPVPLDGLRSWLRSTVGDVGSALAVEPLSGGSSNLTFRLRDGAGHDWVLRRPPLGPLLATANDVLREFRVQRALAGTEVPVATMVGACDDADVIGAPFYLMEHVDGVVYADATDVAHLDDAAARRASFELVDALARLHAVVPESVGLGDLGRPSGFVARQLGRWRRQWQASSDGDVPDVVDEVGRRLAAAMPKERPATLVHGDFSFNNSMWRRERPTELLAILDWEMSTRGDPLTDLGMLVAYWGEAGALLWRGRAPQPHRSGAGFPTAPELVDRYAATSGRDVADLPFHVALATYKLAVITAGAAARLAATGEHDRAAPARALTARLAALALDALGGAT